MLILGKVELSKGEKNTAGQGKDSVRLELPAVARNRKIC